MVSKKSNLINMNNSDLEKLSKSELIKLLLKQNAGKPIKIEIMDDKPVPKPRKSVKDMVQQYEDNIILPPPVFRDRPIPKPRTEKPLQAPIPTPRTKKTSEKPVPEKRTIISQVENAKVTPNHSMWN